VGDQGQQIGIGQTPLRVRHFRHLLNCVAATCARVVFNNHSYAQRVFELVENFNRSISSLQTQTHNPQVA